MLNLLNFFPFSSIYWHYVLIISQIYWIIVDSFCFYLFTGNGVVYINIYIQPGINEDSLRLKKYLKTTITHQHTKIVIPFCSFCFAHQKSTPLKPDCNHTCFYNMFFIIFYTACKYKKKIKFVFKQKIRLSCCTCVQLNNGCAHKHECVPSALQVWILHESRIMHISMIVINLLLLLQLFRRLV